MESDYKQMKFDIQINIVVEADNELAAEKYVKDIMDDVVKTENHVESWDYIEYIVEDPQDISWTP